MTDERYQHLMWDSNDPLTEAEMTEGWHWCRDFDELLIGPGMDDLLERCNCRKSADAEPSIAQMRQELAQAGWVERNSTTYIAPGGNWYRGPYGAWKVMKQLASAPMAETNEGKE